MAMRVRSAAKSGVSIPIPMAESGVTAAGAVQAVAFIREAEDLRLRMYKCSAGKWTVGWGHNIEDNGIPLEAAEVLLLHDCKAVEEDLDAVYPWWRKLDEVRQAVLFEMAFVMGLQRLSSFKVTTLPAMQRGDYALAARGIAGSKFARDVKERRAGRLVQMMATGRWP